MLVYFPQWQGSGTGKSMKNGAETVLQYLDRDVKTVPLSNKQLHKSETINCQDALLEQLNTFKQKLIDAKPKTINTIGGDCGLEIIPVSYLAATYNNLGVIWFDAHADINLPEESPSKNFHGMPLRTLLGEGHKDFTSLLFKKINASQIHYVGLRSIDKAEQVKISNANIYAPLASNAQDLIDTLKSKNITQLYIHFDVDCLDPKAYKNAYFNVENGITTEQAENYIKTLKENFEIVGTSILESVATNDEELNPIKNIINLLFDT